MNIYAAGQLVVLLGFPYVSVFPEIGGKIQSRSILRVSAASHPRQAPIHTVLPDTSAKWGEGKWIRLSLPRWKVMKVGNLVIRSDAKVGVLRNVGKQYKEVWSLMYGNAGFQKSVILHLFCEEGAFRAYATLRGEKGAPYFFDSDYQEWVTSLRGVEDSEALFQAVIRRSISFVR